MRRLLLFAAVMEMEPALQAGIPEGWEVRCTGVGPIAAAVGTARTIIEYAPDEILYLGTCGCYPGTDLTIGEVAAAERVVFTSGEISEGLARIPEIQRSILKCASFERSEILRSVDVVCTIGVTEDDALASRLSKVGDVENLELFSVRMAAGDIPLRSLLGVTNIVGPHGGREWKENHAEVMSRVAKQAFRL